MKGNSEKSNSMHARSQTIRAFSTSVIFSAVAVASSTILLIIPNLETLTIFFFIVGYQYGKSTGIMTVLTSVTIFELFASQFYGTGGLIPFFLKFPPFILVMFTGVYFRKLKDQDTTSLKSSSPLTHEPEMLLYRPLEQAIDSNVDFSSYERFLLAQLGFVLTIIYDIVTSVSLIVFVPTWEAVFLSFITGLPFFLLHQVTNAVIFATFPSIIIALNKARPV